MEVADHQPFQTLPKQQPIFALNIIVPYIFTELPTCVPVQCGLPESPENGKAHYTALAYKSVVTYTCKYGFMVVGDDTRTCGEDKRWSGQDPKCKEINCGSPGFLPNGKYQIFSYIWSESYFLTF